jgi:anaerobic magnesium-protoporphyrin IX monomethyl ester cyclase
MAKVLFINPVIRQEDVPRHIPYGIALLAAIAMKAGHLVQVYDANAWRAGDDVLRQAIAADDWDVIATGGITTTYGHVKSICRLARQHGNKALVVVGGGLLTAMPREIMSLIPEIDIGVIGEAFRTFNEILDHVDEQQHSLAEIDGIIFRDGVELRLTAARGLLNDLDTLPAPAYELFPLEEVYFPNSQVLFSEEGMTAKRRIDINASYGCSLICKFCFHLGLSGDIKYVLDDNGAVDVQFDTPGSYKRVIRFHSPRYIVNLVKSLNIRYGIDYVAFLDENMMTMDQYSRRTWLRGICDLWIAEGLQPSCVRQGVPHDESCRGVHWDGTSHATLCTQEILQKMHEAGCACLLYGYESFSPQILKRLGKGATRETNLRSFFWTLNAGIRPIPNQIIGFPSEDFASLHDDMRAWEELGIVVKPFFATPYPGSMWYDIYKERILAQYGGNLEKFLLELGDATKITAVISENFNAVELYGLRELMVNFDYDRIAEYEREWRSRHPDADAMKAADSREQARKPLAKLHSVT